MTPRAASITLVGVITADTPPPRRRRRRTLLLGSLGAIVVATGGSEAFLRWRYGLGDPPQSMSDPQTEYRYVPSRHYRRLGNRIDYNAYSMRSDDFPATKSSAGERRVLVIGDSVINGGGYTDQADLATSILQSRLRHDVTPAVFVGNASAGSWGPQNELGFVKEFGLLGADVVVIVESSHDARDEVEQFPTTAKVDPPAYRFALVEAADKLRSQYLSGVTISMPGDPPPNHVGAAEPCLKAFGELIDLVRAGGAQPIVVFNYERHELDESVESEGHRMLRDVCESRGLTPVLLKDAFKASLAAGRDPYRDFLHPNEIGQRLLADVITPLVEAALARTATTAPDGTGSPHTPANPPR